MPLGVINIYLSIYRIVWHIRPFRGIRPPLTYKTSFFPGYRWQRSVSYKTPPILSVFFIEKEGKLMIIYSHKLLN
jgi:hypothetical protein